jgi:RND family efflux transporter MFP subunit
MSLSSPKGFLTFGLGLLVSTSLFAQPGGTPVRVGSVQTEELQAHRKVVGTLRAVSMAKVAAREEGAVLEVFFRAGQSVEEGDVLARMDDRRLKAQIAEAAASITEAQALVSQYLAELEEAKFDLNVAKQLFERDAVSESDVVSAERAIGVTEARIHAAEEALEAARSRKDLLEVRLGDMVVLAPFDGVVTERHVEPGEWVDPGNPVMTVLLRGKIEAWLNVPERFTDFVGTESASVVLEIPSNGKLLTTEEIRIISNVNERSRTFTLIADLTNASGTLKPGMSVNSWLPLGEKTEQLTVPRDAVIQDATGAHVFRVVNPSASAAPQTTGNSGNGNAAPALPTAERIPVTILFAQGDRVAVSTSQLANGDEVIVEGNERLFPNSPVMVYRGETKVADSTAQRRDLPQIP